MYHILQRQKNFKTLDPTNTFGFSHIIANSLCRKFTIYKVYKVQYTKVTNNIITLTIQ